MLFDNHGRPIQYLRLAVTDRCNLRCHYCMPEHGLDWLGRAEILSYEEMLRLCRLLCSMGISKIRVTGGEPFVRRDLMFFLEKLSEIDGLRELSITTNGVGTARFVPRLAAIGVRSVNLSLDTLDRERFFQITRRDELPAVLSTLDALLAHGIAVKINSVVMRGLNDADILPMAELAERLPVDVRFIEEMPFNGGDHEAATTLFWDHRRILERLRSRWPGLERLPSEPFSTSVEHQIPGFRGKVGIIAAWSRTFCGTCNRIRLTPQGVLKTCLYDSGVLQIRDLMRGGATDGELAEALLSAFQNRPRDGHEAAARRADSPILESMASIGG